MTAAEATAILKTKYPSGRIYYDEIGRGHHSNPIVFVQFSELGKGYRYKGCFEAVLCQLGALTITPIDQTPCDPSTNPFLLALKNNL